VLRGGSFNNNSNNARAAYRNNNTPDNRNNNIGFRVVVVRRPTTYLLSHEERVRPLFPRRLHAPAWPTADGATSSGGSATGSRFQSMLADYGL
jgi:hypothetical protein